MIVVNGLQEVITVLTIQYSLTQYFPVGLTCGAGVPLGCGWMCSHGLQAKVAPASPPPSLDGSTADRMWRFSHSALSWLRNQHTNCNQSKVKIKNYQAKGEKWKFSGYIACLKLTYSLYQAKGSLLYITMLVGLSIHLNINSVTCFFYALCLFWPLKLQLVTS